jgi:DNA-binding winged helix-turn-helix (wHTH) protein
VKIYRFGIFELNRDSAELRKRGTRIRLSEQPFRVLCSLLDNEGRIVSRESLRAALWPEDTFVEFERGLNAAVAKLRRTLGDSAEKTRFIETHAGRGYRFLPVTEALPGATAAGAARGQQGTSDGSLRMVGRHQESARLLKLMDGVISGKGSMALICGEAGIGKTRLCREPS